MAVNVMRWPPPFHVSRTRRFRCWAANGQCERDYYEILGVPPDASTQNIRKAYRKLQKQHHPDISGSKGHSMTLMLNEAYQTLTDDKLRAKYNATFPHLAEVKLKQHSSFTGSMYSTWNGPDRPQGVFVDENSCIGCRQCAFVASNTFLFDESTARARVKTQWADSDETIKVAIQTCPVNCIHYVDRSDLHILEYLMCPRLKPSNGVFGGGWEKPSNIFMAAKDFKRQQEKLKEQHNTTNTSSEGETAAQRRARMDAELKVHFGPLWSLFTWMNSYSSSLKTSGKTAKQTGKNRPLFGKSCSSEVFNCVIPLEDMSKTVERLKDWAVTFASSSELPLPMPFQVDFLNNGVKLKLVSAGDGVLTTVGSLYINVEVVEDENTGDVRAKQGIYENVGVKEGIRGKECFVCISRDVVTNTGPLPGERRIVKLVEKLLKGDTAYSSYSIPRNVKQS